MNNDKNSSLGIVFRPEYPPEELPGFARRAEEAGFDELWLWEDCFFAGGIASAATALAETEHISVNSGRAATQPILPRPFPTPGSTSWRLSARKRIGRRLLIATWRPALTPFFSYPHRTKDLKNWNASGTIWPARSLRIVND